MAGTRSVVRLLIVAVITLFRFTGAAAQEIQNGLSYRDISADRYFRFNYENDVFFGTDRYFTQGVHFELLSPALSRSPIRKLFPAFRSGQQRCGIGLESAGYSPTSITADSILYGDHPFAGLAYAKLFSISIDTMRRRRLSGTLSLGWMGPSAGGYEIQAAIHRAVGSAEPLGWKYQLKDQPVINYELNVEQEIGGMPRWLRVSAWGMARAGTLSSRLSVGGIAVAGRTVGRHCAVSVYAHPAISVIAHEAVLQGGPFTKDNPYAIADAEVQRLLASGLGGIDVRIGTLCAGAYARWRTATFRGGSDHALGGLTLAIAF